MDTIYIPTKLASASYNLSLNGHRLKLLAMSQLDHFNNFLAYAPPIKITASDWQLYFPDSENPYRDLKRAAKELSEAKVIFEASKNQVSFFSTVKYVDGSGYVELVFSERFLRSCV